MVSALTAAREMAEPQPDRLTEVDEMFFEENARGVKLSRRAFYLIYWIRQAETGIVAADLLDEAALDYLESRYNDNMKIIAPKQKAHREKKKKEQSHSGSVKGK